MDERLAAFRRTTADEQRRLGHALADALSAIAHRVDRIEREPGSQAGIESELAQLRSTVEGLAGRKDLLALERTIARVAAAQSEREELLRKDMADLVRKLEAVAEACSPARLDMVADRLAAVAARLKEVSAPDETSSRLDLVQETLNQLVKARREARGGEEIAALKEEIQSLKAAQAMMGLRVAEGLSRIEAALSRPATSSPTSAPAGVREETRPDVLRRTFVAAARSGRSRRPRDAGPKDAAPTEAVDAGTDLPRALEGPPQRGLPLLGFGAVVLAGLLYLAYPSLRAPEAPPTAAPAPAAAVAPPAQGAPVPAKAPEAVAPPAPARGSFSAADHAALEEFASRLLRGEEMVRDRAMEVPPGALQPIAGNSRS